jgi:hypothetical protein
MLTKSTTRGRKDILVKVGRKERLLVGRRDRPIWVGKQTCLSQSGSSPTGLGRSGEQSDCFGIGWKGSDAVGSD